MSLMTCSLTWERENNLFPPATLDILCNREEMFPCVKQTLLIQPKNENDHLNDLLINLKLFQTCINWFFLLKKKNEDTLNHVGG